MYNACILMCLIFSLFFYVIRKDHCFLINTYFKGIILLIPTCHYIAKKKMDGPLRDKMFLLPKNLASYESLKLHNFLDLSLRNS